MKDIEKKLFDFEKSLNVTDAKKRKHYIEMKRMLLNSEQMSTEKLIELAHRIKPLMRLNSPRSLGSVHLVWIVPYDLRESFYYDFKDSLIVKNENGVVPVTGLKKVREIKCYHNYGGSPCLLRPSTDEIIQQFPADLLNKKNAQYAFEVTFPSLKISDVYDSIIDRHVSNVTIYQVMYGYPPEVENQEIICK